MVSSMIDASKLNTPTMLQLKGSPATPEHVQAVFRDLLCEFRQQVDCTAEFAAETDGGMLAAFCRRKAEMLGKAKARLHSSTRHSKTARQGRVTVQAQSASPARTPAWATDDSAPPKIGHGRSWARSVQVAPATPTPTPTTPPISPEPTNHAYRPATAAMNARAARKTRGWITAAATAAVRAKDDTIHATVPAATAKAKAGAVRAATPAARPWWWLPITSTPARTTRPRTARSTRSPRAVDRYAPCAKGNAVSADLGPRPMPSARPPPRRRPRTPRPAQRKPRSPPRKPKTPPPRRPRTRRPAPRPPRRTRPTQPVQRPPRPTRQPRRRPRRHGQRRDHPRRGRPYRRGRREDQG